MLKIKLEQYGKNMLDLEQEIKFLPEKIKMLIKQKAEEAKLDMQNKIEGDRKRSKTPTRKPHISDLIEVEELMTPMGFMIGIGNIQKIEQSHRDPLHSTDTGQGWKMLNWGGKIPGGGTHPRGSFIGDKFDYNPELDTRLYPKKVMEGIHFIESAAANLNMKLRTIVGELLK